MRNLILKLLGRFFKKEILTQAVSDLYNTISDEDIIRIEGDSWTINGKPYPNGQKKLLIAEAKTLLNSRLWKELQNDVRYKANKIMFEKAKSDNDLVAGKLFLYTLDCINTRLKQLK